MCWINVRSTVNNSFLNFLLEIRIGQLTFLAGPEGLFERIIFSQASDNSAGQSVICSRAGRSTTVEPAMETTTCLSWKLSSELPGHTFPIQ